MYCYVTDLPILNHFGTFLAASPDATPAPPTAPPPPLLLLSLAAGLDLDPGCCDGGDDKDLIKGKEDVIIHQPSLNYTLMAALTGPLLSSLPPPLLPPDQI